VQTLYVYSVVHLGSGCGVRPRPNKYWVRLTRQLGLKAHPTQEHWVVAKLDPIIFFFTKNNKDNTLWCYNITYNANTRCLHCGTQCKYSMYTVYVQCFFLDLAADPAVLDPTVKPDLTIFFLTKNKKQRPKCYNIVYNTNTLCLECDS
jgi:hypothetical protein